MEEKAKADPEAVFKLVELSAYLSLSTATAIGYLHIPWEQILVVEDEKVLSIPKIAEVVRTHPVSYYDDEFVLDFDDSRLERILNKHDDCFSVVKTAHKSKWGDLQLTAYQMNNSLPTTEEKILKPITEQAIRIIEELKKPDDITYLKYFCRWSVRRQRYGQCDG